MMTTVVSLVVMMLVVAGCVMALDPRERMPGINSGAWLAFQTGLPADLASDPALARYARRSRWGRVIGVVGGYFVGGALIVVFERPEPGVLMAMAAGWFAGGLLPELFVRNRRAPAVRVAELDGRSVLRYVTPTARRWLVAGLVLTVAAPVAGVAPSASRLIGVVVGSVLLAGLAIVSLRRIALRAQPAGSPFDVLVDDAIRALATTRVLCGWMALQFLAAAWLAPLSLQAPTFARVLAGAMVWAAWVGVVAAWAWVPTRVLRPRHRSTSSAVLA